MSASLAASEPKTKAAPTNSLSPAVMATYARHDLVFERGEGAWLITSAGDGLFAAAAFVLGSEAAKEADIGARVSPTIRGPPRSAALLIFYD